MGQKWEKKLEGNEGELQKGTRGRMGENSTEKNERFNINSNMLFIHLQ